MYILLGVIFIFVGVLMTVSPRTCYDITQGWKNNSKAEPSKMYIITTRLAGIVFFILAILAFVLFFCF